MFKGLFKTLSRGVITALAVITLASCNGNNEENGSSNNNNTNNPSSSTVEYEKLTETNENVGFAIHYNKRDKVSEKYKYNLWLWEQNGTAGGDYQFNAENEYGVVCRVKWSEFSTTAQANGIGFIIKTNKTWEEGAVKDGDSDRFIDFTHIARDKYGYYNVYLKNGDQTIYSGPNGEVNDEIKTFDLTYNKITGYKVWFQTNKEFESFTIKAGDDVIVSNETISTDPNKESATSKKVVYKLGEDLPDIKKDYTLQVKFKESQVVLNAVANKSVLYATKQFDDLYTYNGELGAIYTPMSTTFKVWSPISTDIKLRIYETGTPKSMNGSDEYLEYQMIEEEKGVWSYTQGGNLEGKYYTYVVTNSNYKNKEVVDPYAKSTGINGLRGMIVDFSKTNPEGWDTISAHDYSSTQLTVYETHIADLTSSSTWGGNTADSKKYTGFYQEGTTYTKDGKTVSTGFDHIKELGVNAVQLIPIFDQANDEREGKVEFNWGYNPLNYNSLEGCYSTNPYDGYQKIKEFKQLVYAYNQAGINIIMDVVYNHTAGLDGSNFDVLMPKYYFRYTNGVASNGSGCGNETASEMPMYRKFMIDSTEFWATEYKLGGFRFDLMGIHDVETMNALSNNLHEKIGNHITIYGEPWAGGTIALTLGTPANQNAMALYQGFGCFNDKIRDALIKGGLSGKEELGWITNSEEVSFADVVEIKNGLVGLILNGNQVEPEKCVNYVTCHDNYTLYDRIKAAGIKDEETIKKMAMLSNSVVFTSQGITFMLSGEEFLRTKGGNSNSYNASYKVNELDYSLKIKNYDMFENYKKLIELKQNKELFGLNGTDSSNVTINMNTNGSLIYYELIDKVNNVSYKIIHSNGVKAEKVVDLEGYTLYLDTLNKEDLTLSNNTVVEEYQTIIAYKQL